MKKYWNDTTVYSQPSAEELRRRASESLQTATKKGRHYEPVIVKTTRGPICESWWGQAWCENLEGYADYASRLERGQRYVRSGAVVDLQIRNGSVEAKVQGRRKAPYKVTIHIGRLSEEKCQSIIGRCNQKISSIETLVSGEFPEELKDVFTEEGGLFPTPREISFSCTCPDWALMCKHVAAVMYAIGVRFDENPFYFFELRGIDVDRFINVALENRLDLMLEHADCSSDRILSSENVNALFGIL